MREYSKIYFIATFFLSFVFSSGISAVVSGVSTLESIALQPDDKILGVGYHTEINTDHAFVVRLTSGGISDSTFGTNGRTRLSVSGSAQLHGVVVKSTGEIIVVGSHESNYFIAQLTSAGAFDTSFNGTGYVSVSVGSGAALKDVVLDGSGNIVATGAAIIGGFGQLLTVRYTGAGNLDTSFNGTGQVITDTGESSFARDVAIQSDGKIVLAGGATTKGLLVRYNSNGSLDTTFNTTGMVKTAIGSIAQFNDVAIDASNNIVAVGRSGANSLIARYDSSGTLDTANFNNPNGYATLDGGDPSRFDIAAIQTDDKILTSGLLGDQMQLVRYNTDGMLDTSFANQGIFAVQNEDGDEAVGLAIQSTGRIVLGVNTGDSFYFSGFTTAGILDSTFGDLGNQLAVPGQNQIYIQGNNYLFAYSTVLQTVNNSLAGMIFHFATQSNGWSVSLPARTFTCNQTGRYHIVYDLTISREVGEPFVSAALFINDTEVPGSQQIAKTREAHEAVPMSNSVVTTINSGDTLEVRAAGFGGNAILLSGEGEGAVRPSIRLTATRLE